MYVKANGNCLIMKPIIFKKLWPVIKKEIGKTIESYAGLCKVRIRETDENFENSIYHRYEAERIKYRGTVGVGEEFKLDRHKVAALFYAAFVDNASGYVFEVFNEDARKTMSKAEEIVTHETSFNIARGILETIITENNRTADAGYKKYVMENGLAEPDPICCDGTSYKEEVLKQIIYAQQKEKKLSVAQLAVMFSLWESYSILKYKSAP